MTTLQSSPIGCALISTLVHPSSWSDVKGDGVLPGSGRETCPLTVTSSALSMIVDLSSADHRRPGCTSSTGSPPGRPGLEAVAPSRRGCSQGLGGCRL